MLAGHKIDWYQKVSYFAFVAIAGMVFVLVYSMRPIQAMQQTLKSSTVVIEKPAATPEPPPGRRDHPSRWAGVKPPNPSRSQKSNPSGAGGLKES